jgi:hypothetical protein
MSLRLARVLILALAAWRGGPISAQAQPAANQPPESEPPAARFLAVDIFGGARPEPAYEGSLSGSSTKYGWELGGTVWVARWIGVTGGWGRVRTPERDWIEHVQAGARVATQVGQLKELRGYAHLLVGRASFRPPTGPVTDRSWEGMAGGGLDAFRVFRAQIDLIARDLPHHSGLAPRLMFAVAMPLCFSGCAEGDGFDVSRR